MNTEFLMLQILNSIIFKQISEKIPDPYMDEPFHLDQQQHYLDHDFSYWNPKLTTPFALYLINYPFIKLIQIFFNRTTLFCARFLNLFLYSNLNFLIATKITNKYTAFALQLVPIIYFYNFLFYTEPFSILTINLMYYLLIKRKNNLSGIISLVSVLSRQTNLLWTIYLCIDNHIMTNQNTQDTQNLLKYINNFIIYILQDLKKIIKQYKFHLITVLLSLIYYIQNGGIVLGDKSNHIPVNHWAQICYSILFILPFIPIDLEKILRTIKNIIKNKKNILVFLSLAILSYFFLIEGKYEHPFILSDNRHYVFYLWKRFLSIHNYRLFLVPLTSIAFFFLYYLYGSTTQKSFSFILLIIINSIIVFPSGLIEFRYYIQILIFLYYKSENQSKYFWYFTILIYVIANLTFQYIFIYKPFQCDLDLISCRFMF